MFYFFQRRLGPLVSRLLRPPIYKPTIRNKVLFNRYFYSLTAFGSALVGGAYIFQSDLRRRLFPSCIEAATVSGGNVPQNVNFIADVVEKVLPAVVFIETGTPNRFIQRTGSGSGFIFREDGLILTNGHVVGNNRNVRVRLANGQQLNGTVIAIDAAIDVALVSISAKDLPTISMGQSQDLRTGEWVVALGSPHFLTNSVTVGVVSAKERDLGHARGMRYIQTDAVITHGNSGGPLVNVKGEVVGINTLKLEAGIGFAVPADVVNNFVQLALKEWERRTEPKGGIFSRLFDSSGGVSKAPDTGSSQKYADNEVPSNHRRTYIGVSMLTLTPNILRDLSLMRPGYFDGVAHGVLVHSVHYNSPADESGLRPFDVIIAVNNKEIRSAEEMHSAISKEKGPLKMVVVRGGRHLTLTVNPEHIDV